MEDLISLQNNEKKDEKIQNEMNKVENGENTEENEEEINENQKLNDFSTLNRFFELYERETKKGTSIKLPVIISPGAFVDNFIPELNETLDKAQAPVKVRFNVKNSELGFFFFPFKKKKT